MVKIYKTNKDGGCGVSIPKQMKAAGYTAGKFCQWEAANGGFILRIIQKEETKTVAPSGPTA